MICDIYGSGYKLNDLLKPVFIFSPKRPGAIKCERFPTINQIKHVPKLLFRNRIRRRIKLEISKEHWICGQERNK